MRRIILGLTITAYMTTACGQATDDQNERSAQPKAIVAEPVAKGTEDSQATGSTDEDAKGLKLAPVIIGVGMLIGVLVDVLLDNNTAVAPEPQNGCKTLAQQILDCSNLRQRFGSGPAGPQCIVPSYDCQRAQTACSNAAWESLLTAFRSSCVKTVEEPSDVSEGY